MNTTDPRSFQTHHTDRKGDWFQTFTGIRFYPLDARPEDICIDDIAHSLARICRFGGHTTEFYSVAQHSVIVSRIVPPGLELVGLMHDATEAYVGDVVRPLKYSLPNYIEIEDRLWEIIAARFNLPNVLPPEVKRADNIALVTERRDLLNKQQQWGEWTKNFPPLESKIIPRLSESSETMFIERFNELTGMQQ